jgi:hypothetical protein
MQQADASHADARPPPPHVSPPSPSPPAPRPLTHTQFGVGHYTGVRRGGNPPSPNQLLFGEGAAAPTSTQSYVRAANEAVALANTLAARAGASAAGRAAQQQLPAQQKTHGAVGSSAVPAASGGGGFGVGGSSSSSSSSRGGPPKGASASASRHNGSRSVSAAPSPATARTMMLRCLVDSQDALQRLSGAHDRMRACAEVCFASARSARNTTIPGACSPDALDCSLACSHT